MLSTSQTSVILSASAVTRVTSLQRQRSKKLTGFFKPSKMRMLACPNDPVSYSMPVVYIGTFLAAVKLFVDCWHPCRSLCKCDSLELLFEQ